DTQLSIQKRSVWTYAGCMDIVCARAVPEKSIRRSIHVVDVFARIQSHVRASVAAGKVYDIGPAVLAGLVSGVGDGRPRTSQSLRTGIVPAPVRNIEDEIIRCDGRVLGALSRGDKCVDLSPEPTR